MLNYKTVSFKYPLNKIIIKWNFKNRFDLFTVDNIGYESFLESVQYYVKNKTIEQAELIANELVKKELI